MTTSIYDHGTAHEAPASSFRRVLSSIWHALVRVVTS